MANKRKVLFLCTGNSCRSQMAEAIVNARLGDGWQASSAGTAPAGYVHPMALNVLAEIGIQHSGISKHVDDLKGQTFDLVITVCDAVAENCPLWLGSGMRVHSGFPDPAKAAGDDEALLAVFRQVRDGISERIVILCRQFDKEGRGPISPFRCPFAGKISMHTLIRAAG